MQRPLLDGEGSAHGGRWRSPVGLARVSLALAAVVVLCIGARRFGPSATMTGLSTRLAWSSGAARIEGCHSFATPPLHGQSHSVWDSIPETYIPNGIVANWDAVAGNYSWKAPTYEGRAEHGRGFWLGQKRYLVDEASGHWTTRAFVGTQALEKNHTTCCCQFMTGNSQYFWLTEWCRAVVPGMPPAEEACAPYSAPCPEDNASAALQEWPIKMYIEVYHLCLGPLSPLPP